LEESTLDAVVNSKPPVVNHWEIVEPEEEEEEDTRVLSAEELADRLLLECPPMEGNYLLQ
jgi:hypothetical protein